MRTAQKITELIGKTPLLEIIPGIFAKLEMFNPLSSVKDRAAFYMLKNAGLQRGAQIVEPTSGNTGIALAYISRVMGFKITLTMPETMSVERRKILSALGAELVLTDGAKGMPGAIARAKEIAAERGAFMPNQFENPFNALAHKETTGPEIWEAMEGKVDYFVAGVGTGGTITGAGEFLKSKNPDIKIIAIEPSASPVLSGGKAGPHKIQGIGAGFVPKILNVNIIDEIIAVSNEDAFNAARTAAERGVFAGISGGAALHAARLLAARPENAGKNIVAILPDTGERYLSTELYGNP